MKKEMKELLQNTYKGNEIIEYIELLERENKALDEEGVAKCELNKQLEKALDKACELISSDVCINCYACYFEKECKSKEADKCIANNMNKEEWKEWCMKNE